MSFEKFNYFEIEVGNTYKDFLCEELSILKVIKSKKYWNDVHIDIDEFKVEEIDFE